MKLTGAQMVCESLIREGVDTMFGIPGGAILPLYQTFHQYPQLKHILVRHEQGAAMAADGYYRVTGKVGVAMATSGPGATNLVTGLATAQMDSTAIVAITGQVSRGAIGKDGQCRYILDYYTTWKDWKINGNIKYIDDYL